MVRAVVGLAIAGLVLLVVALISGSTPMAVVVIGLAITGIVLLLRDWRTDSTGGSASSAEEFGTGSSGAALTPDEFSPDISADPNGPSSDARAD